MRIYLGLTNTGGKVLGSFEVEKIYKYTYDILNSYYVYHHLGSSKDFAYHNNIGCTGQKYAIEIIDFVEENLTVKDFTKFDTDESVKLLPQSFVYVDDICCKDDKAILIPIHQEWFDKIKNGEKKWEFRNKLPNALKGEE